MQIIICPLLTSDGGRPHAVVSHPSSNGSGSLSHILVFNQKLAQGSTLLCGKYKLSDTCVCVVYVYVCACVCVCVIHEF